jgi:uncharacterized membrane protein
MRARPLLWTAVVSYAVGFSALSVLRQRSFATGRFDLGNMVQAVWSTAHGRLLDVTTLRGDQISRLGAHVDPILALLAPLWWLWPSPDLLLVAQTIALALGALPVYRLAHRQLGSERAALGFALAYLLYPPVQWLTIDEFHPIALATPLLLWGIDLLDRDRPLAFAGVAVLAIATKEEVGLVVALLGAWYWLRRRDRWGVGIAAGGILASVIAIAVIVPHFRHGHSAFFDRYHEVGGSPAGILKTAVTRPWHLAATAFDARGLKYLFDLFWPLAFLPLAAPLLALTALPELAINLLSATKTQTSIHFHYTGAILPALIAASVVGAGRMARRREIPAERIAVAALVLVICANYRMGPLPIWRFLPGGQQLQSRSFHVTDHDRVAQRAVALVPEGVPVSVSNSMGAHLSARRRVMSFPYVRDARWIAVDERLPGYADRQAPLAYAQRIAQIRRNPRWRLVFEQDGVLVFRLLRIGTK